MTAVDFFTFPAWAYPLLGGKPAPDPKAPDTATIEPPKPTKRGRGRPPGAKNKAK